MVKPCLSRHLGRMTCHWKGALWTREVCVCQGAEGCGRNVRNKVWPAVLTGDTMPALISQYR